jgi:hypothetical protein
VKGRGMRRTLRAPLTVPDWNVEQDAIYTCNFDQQRTPPQPLPPLPPPPPLFLQQHIESTSCSSLRARTVVVLLVLGKGRQMRLERAFRRAAPAELDVGQLEDTLLA